MHLLINKVSFLGCAARSIWLLARHGTRNPGKKDIKTINVDGSGLRDRILRTTKRTAFTCEEDVEKLQNWKFHLSEGKNIILSKYFRFQNLLTSIDEFNELTNSGRLEHFQLGARYKSRLPQLFQGNYSSGAFQINYTSKV